jgi:hypothetical protein
MRLAAIFIALLFLEAGAWASPLSDEVVSVFKDVCVSPANSDERMAAAEKRAKDDNWTLLVSRPVPRPFMHNERATIDSLEAVWELNLREGSKARLAISILRPEPPGQRHTVCTLTPATDSDARDLASSVDRQFGSLVERDMSGRYKDLMEWFFAEDKARGNCGKKISIVLNESHDHGQPKSIMFSDLAYPSEDEFMTEIAQCPKTPTP